MAFGKAQRIGTSAVPAAKPASLVADMGEAEAPATGGNETSGAFYAIMDEVRQSLVEIVDAAHLDRLNPAEARSEIAAAIRRILERRQDPVPTFLADRLVDELVDDILGFGPLEPLLAAGQPDRHHGERTEGCLRRIRRQEPQGAVAAGSPILWNNLSSRHAETLSARLAEGQFAMSIVVSEATAAGGLVVPGDRVDLIQTQGRTAGEAMAARIIARDLPVLAVDQAMTRLAETTALPGRTLTLQVSEALVPEIAAANAAGGLSVALRAARAANAPAP